MPVMLNLSNGRMLPASELEALRNIARSNQSDVLFVGSRSFRLHHISFMDGFSVEPIPGGFLECIGERSQRQLADSLEKQLNGGNSFLQEFSLYMEQTVERVVKYLKESFFVRYCRFDNLIHDNQLLVQ